MSEQTESNVVEFPELQFPPIEYGVTEAALAELTERYKDPDASTDEGYARCKDGCKEMTSLRTAVEIRRKDLKAPALNWGAKVDKIAKALVRSIKLIESPVREEKERVDEIKQTEARKAAEAEQARIDGIKANIEKIATTAREQSPNDTAADYQQHITWLTELAITDEVFGEFVDEANTARDAALFKLTQWHDAAVNREETDRKQAAEKAALDQQREEQEATEQRLREAEEALEKKALEAEELKAAEEKAAQEKGELEQREKREAQERRVWKIKAAIDSQRNMPDRTMGLSSQALGRMILAEKADEPTEEGFAEFLPQAKQAWQESIDRLEVMADDARAVEEKERRDEEARLPDKDKLVRWCESIADIPEPEVLNDKAQKILKRYASDLSKFTQRLRSDIEKL